MVVSFVKYLAICIDKQELVAVYLTLHYEVLIINLRPSHKFPHPVMSVKRRIQKFLIGGGKDNSSNYLPTSAKRLQRYGTKAVLLFDEKERHYMLLHQKEKIIAFLNHELE